MPAPFSLDLRKRILNDCGRGMRNPEVAEKYSVSIPFVKKLKQRQKQTGSPAPKPHGGGRRRALAARHADIHRIVQSGQATTVAAVHQQLQATCSVKTVWEEMRRLGYRFKKRH